MASKKRSRSKPKVGRPRGHLEKVTISFRIPAKARDEFVALADEESGERVGAEVRVSEVYNRALGEFAEKYGIRILGWNA